ncbi:MAG: BCAM0308 family protein [Methylohalobius sp.]|nr:BCAM0308 family protein [Methylohalobius sp.]
MSSKEQDVAGFHSRHDRLLKERVHDPYMTRSKPKEPSVCPQCGVVFDEGRWQWQPAPPVGASEELCPACQRIRDKVPAGFLTLSGEFFQQHREEILNLVRNKVEEQRAQHPLKRVMAIEEQEDGSCVISFTEMHLPQSVGEAVEHAYKGELEITYPEEGSLVRAAWRR